MSTATQRFFARLYPGVREGSLLLSWFSPTRRHKDGRQALETSWHTLATTSLARLGACAAGGGRPGAGPWPRGGVRSGVLFQEKAPDEAGEAFRVLHRPFMQPPGQHDRKFLDGPAAFRTPGLARWSGSRGLHPDSPIKFMVKSMAYFPVPGYSSDYNTDFFHG